jgi:tRNA A-37 threonylcarbamoyl transferase component Bud32
MNHKFQQIIDDGEVSQDILDLVLKKMGDIEDLHVTSSNGMSFVFISKEKDNVYQYFKNDIKPKKIFNIIYYVSKNRTITILNIDNNYDLFVNIAEFVSYIPQNIIVWKKHKCLNEFNSEKIEEIISENIFKLLWDIGKCLYAFDKINLIHGDARIDNIGIANNKFILFDFDNTSFSNKESYNKDIHDFITSIKFNLGKKANEVFIPQFSSHYNFLYQIINKIHLKYDQRLDYDDIIYTLDNMEINI